MDHHSTVSVSDTVSTFVVLLYLLCFFSSQRPSPDIILESPTGSDEEGKMSSQTKTEGFEPLVASKMIHNLLVCVPLFNYNIMLERTVALYHLPLIVYSIISPITIDVHSYSHFPTDVSPTKLKNVVSPWYNYVSDQTAKRCLMEVH